MWVEPEEEMKLRNAERNKGLVALFEAQEQASPETSPISRVFS